MVTWVNNLDAGANTPSHISSAEDTLMQLDIAIETLEEAIRFHRFSPAFPERLRIAKALFAGNWAATNLRSLAAPIYITDLGIRHITDPRDFYREHCKISSVVPTTNIEITESLVAIPLERLKDALDAVILFFGNYGSAYKAISIRKDELLGTLDPELLSAAGTICAAVSNYNYEQFFKKAVSLATNFSDSYIYSHRLATALIKRHHRLDRALELLDEQFTICNQLSNTEKEFALLFNLKALAIMMRDKNVDTVLPLVNSSLEMLECAINNPLYSRDSLSRLFRYRSQIHINKAQLLLKLGKHKEAVELLETNLHYTAQHSHEYIGEASASLAFTYYLSGDYLSAIKISHYAIIELSGIGALSALSTARKIFIASQEKMEILMKLTRCFILLKVILLGLITMKLVAHEHSILC